MDLMLKGKIAIVTGGARGIGKAIAGRLVQEGCTVVICDLNNEELQRTAISFQKQNYSVTGYRVDVTNYEEIKNMVDKVYREHGRVDILINNAGTARYSKFVESDRSCWEQDIETSLYGTLNCSRVVVPIMMKAKVGRIVNVSSNSGRIGYRNYIGYASGKAGVLGATKTMALELAPYNIAVNAVAPGFIKTEMTTPAIEAEEKMVTRMHPESIKVRKKMLDKMMPLGMYGYPDDVANMVAFLCSASAARYITGQTISVDGGGTML